LDFAYGRRCLRVGNRADADADRVGTGCTRRHWRGGTARRADLMYLVRGMSAMCALYGGLLLFLAGDSHRYRRVITFQAVAILTVATCESILKHHLPVLGNYIFIDGAVCWLYCLPNLLLQTRLKKE